MVLASLIIFSKTKKTSQMTKQNCSHQDCQSNSSSGFAFGLICGAIIGAVIAVLIYKNNKTEVFKNLEEKIKNFFGNLTKTSSKNSPKTKPTPIPKKIIASSTTSSPRPKKPTPKTFIKPKK